MATRMQTTQVIWIRDDPHLAMSSCLLEVPCHGDLVSELCIHVDY